MGLQFHKFCNSREACYTFAEILKTSLDQIYTLFEAGQSFHYIDPNMTTLYVCKTSSRVNPGVSKIKRLIFVL